MERKGLLELGGNDVTVIGPDIELGQQAPEFYVADQAWNRVYGIEATQGKVRIIMSLPSVSTGVCDAETHRFNEEAAALGDDIVILGISTDLPYTLKNYCAANGIDQVMMLSDAIETDFGQRYGTLVKERRILRRAVFVVNKDGKVDYVAYMPALGEQPDYSAVLAAAKVAK